MSNRTIYLTTGECTATYRMYPLGTPVRMPHPTKLGAVTGTFGGIVQRKANGLPHVRVFFQGHQKEFPVDSNKITLLLKNLIYLTEDEAKQIATICDEPFISLIRGGSGDLLINITTAHAGRESKTDRFIWMRRSGKIELFSNTGDFGGMKSSPVAAHAVYKFLCEQGYAVPLIGDKNAVHLNFARYLPLVDQDIELRPGMVIEHTVTANWDNAGQRRRIKSIEDAPDSSVPPNERSIPSIHFDSVMVYFEDGLQILKSALLERIRSGLDFIADEADY